MLATILQYIGKMDGKTIVILLLLTVLAFFYFKGMFSGDDHSDERKQLEKRNEEIVQEKKDLQDAFVTTREMYVEDSIELSNLKKEMRLLEALLADKEAELKKSKDELKQAQKQVEKTRNEIKDLEENPIKRTGKELLESIDQKTK
jgi:chromosome segregation ATPase